MPREDWDDLRFVLAVAEEGTVSGAARRLRVNHATVLRRIAAFEDRLGGIVFDKTARGYSLTPDKARVLEAAREVDRAVQSVARLLEGARAPLTGKVRLSATDSFCATLLPPILARIADEAPDLTVELTSSNLPADLARTQADLAVRLAERLPDDLVGQGAGRLSFAVFAGLGVPEPRALPWLALAGRLDRSLPGRWQAESLPPDRLGDGADSFLTLRELAALGRGLAILPAYLGHEDARLVPVSGLMPPLSVPIWVASHADLADVQRIARMRTLLAAALLQDGARLAGG